MARAMTSEGPRREPGQSLRRTAYARWTHTRRRKERVGARCGAGGSDARIGIPHESGAPESSVPQTFWNEERVRLLGALRRRSELFADLYRRARDALSEDPPVTTRDSRRRRCEVIPR